MRFVIAFVTIATLNALADADDVRVNSEFPGGSGEVRSIDSANQTIHIHPSLHFDRGWPCWWYVRIDGLQKDKPIAFRLSANPGEFAKGSRLSRAWAQPDRSAISTDNKQWSQTPKYRQLEGGVVEYQFNAPAETVWLAWGPPFLPSHADELLAKIAEKLPAAKRFVLAQTRQGREVQAIRIAADNKPAKRRAIWVQARQHAWEAGSSWVGRGLAEWIAGDDPAAVALRKKTDIYFVPIMDVDNVAQGAGGKNATPRDHNRDWTDTPHYPEVAAAQKHLLRLESQGDLALFIDLHNPGKGEFKPYFFGPMNLKDFAPARRRLYERWISTAASSITSPMKLVPKYRFTTYIKTEEERNRVSCTWVENHTAATAITLETPWDTSHSTTDGYQKVGAQLGQAIATFLEKL